jgi:hypothetical protein
MYSCNFALRTANTDIHSEVKRYSGLFETCMKKRISKFKKKALLTTHVRWVPVITAWRVLRLQMEERPLATEDSCEYIEKAAADKRQGVVLQLGGWAWCFKTLHRQK